MRALEKQVHLGEISYSRMIEIINDKADTLLSDKLLLAYCEIDELTKVIDGYKSDSEELITTKELLLDLTISDKKVYDKQEQRIINLSEKLLISEKSEKFYKDRAKELSDILYLAESENAELTKEVERLRNGIDKSYEYLDNQLFNDGTTMKEANELFLLLSDLTIH